MARTLLQVLQACFRVNGQRFLLTPSGQWWIACNKEAWAVSKGLQMQHSTMPFWWWLPTPQNWIFWFKPWQHLHHLDVTVVNFHFPVSNKFLYFVCTALLSSSTMMLAPSHSDFLSSIQHLKGARFSTVSKHLKAQKRSSLKISPCAWRSSIHVFLWSNIISTLSPISLTFKVCNLSFVVSAPYLVICKLYCMSNLKIKSLSFPPWLEKTHYLYLPLNIERQLVIPSSTGTCPTYSIWFAFELWPHHLSTVFCSAVANAWCFPVMASKTTRIAFMQAS